MSEPTRRTRTTCAIVGGGPAGIMLGLLLARAGVRVTVLEKHEDFLRDFRGDTVHPTTLRLLDDLGLAERFAALPHTRLPRMVYAPEGEPALTFADFGRLRLPYRHIAMVPQWDLLDLLARAAEAEPTFTLRMSTEVTDVLSDNGRVAGVRYRDRDGTGELRADLTVACDGRTSLIRRVSGLRLREYPVGFDVWWFRLPTNGRSAPTGLPRLRPGQAYALLPREDYLQVARFIGKGSDAHLRARGVETFREETATAIPEGADEVEAIESMDEVKLLDVRLDRLRRWHTDGLLCIGDAAHAMSPAGGVGINLAIQDAVATATLLADPLRRGRLTTGRLGAVRRRRLAATIITQALQRILHRRLLGPVLEGRTEGPPKIMIRLLRRFPRTSAILGHLIGVGIRPERAPLFARRPAEPCEPGEPAEERDPGTA